MNAKDLEELTLIREEKRTLSITVENIKSELNQLQSKVYICRTLMMAILFTWADVETLCFWKVNQTLLERAEVLNLK